MTAIRLRLRAAAVVWQQTAVCEPDLETIVASADEVAGWGAGLPFETDQLARAAIGDQAFALIAAPEVGVAWVMAAALRPGDGRGRAVLTAPTTAYGVHTRCEWRSMPRSDEPRAIWQLERDPGDHDWLFARRLVDGAPVGPLSYVALSDVVERWTDEARDPVGVEGPAVPSLPEPPDAASIGMLLAFLRRGAADPTAARPSPAPGDGAELAGEPGREEPGPATDPLQEAAGPSSMLDGWGLAPGAAIDAHGAAEAMSSPTASTDARDPAHAVPAALRIPEAMDAAPPSSEPHAQRSAGRLPDLRSAADIASTSEHGRDPGHAPAAAHRGADAMQASAPLRASHAAPATASSAPLPARDAMDTSHASRTRGAPATPPAAITRATSASRASTDEHAAGPPLHAGQPDAAHASTPAPGAPSAAAATFAASTTRGTDVAAPAAQPPGSGRGPHGAAATTAPASTPDDAHEVAQAAIRAHAAATSVSRASHDPGNAAHAAHAAHAVAAPDRRPGATSAPGTRAATHDPASASNLASASRATDAASSTGTGAVHARELVARPGDTKPLPTATAGAPVAAATRAPSTAAPDARAAQAADRADRASSAAHTTPAPAPRTPPDAEVERAPSATHATPAPAPRTARSTEPEHASSVVHTAPAPAPPRARDTEAERAPARTAATGEPSRGRIAVARRTGDDLGLPSLPASGRITGSQAQRVGGSGETSSHARRSTAPRHETARGPAPPAADEPRRSTAPDATLVPASSTAGTAEPAATTTRTAAPAPIAPRAAESAPIAARIATPPAPRAAALDVVPVATVLAPAAPPAIAHGAPPRRAVNREVRVGDIVVELGDPLPARPAAEHAGTLTAAIPRRTLEPRRRL